MNEPEKTLLDHWMEGTLTDQEELRLEQWLKEDPQNMRQFVTANIREQHLKEAVRSLYHANEVHQKVEPKSSQSSVALPRRASLALGIALTLFVALWFVLPSRSPGVQVNVIAMSDAKLAGVSGSLSVGQMMSLGSFRLESGSMELMLPRSVRVEFIAPVEAVFVDDTHLQLIEGRLSADVGRGGEGFTVLTAAGRVVDQGTSFGLEVEREGEARVAVFSGSIEFHPADTMSSREVVTLTEGEALKFSARNGLRRWQQVAIEADRLGLSRVATQGVVREVHDNLGEGDLRPFYAVLPQGMKPGALAFNDKPNPVWEAEPGKPFPMWLEGADLIRTYYNFRYIEDYELTLVLNKPADVYLLVVSQGHIPDWVQDRFEPTGESIRAGTWHPTMGTHPAATATPNGPYLKFAIWKCEAEAGPLTLGAPLEYRVPGIQSLMYGLAVKAKSSP
ncbi:FecR domain-containing protein [Bremerella sp. JC770]|uniref:FecR domain-containing protein n=1 Tax=Bremerella sp. JC770 TaxID=3232137 RepID=UPI00345B3F52